jgi:putative membrane protein
MFDRKSVVAAVAAMSLGVGTACTISFAQNTPDAGAAKNPAAVPDKSNTAEMNAAPMTEPQMQQKMEDQEKMMADLQTNFNDANFVKVASMANQDEIDAANSAIKNSNSDDVKAFAQHMVDNHTKAGTELKSLADSKGWSVSDQSDVKHMMAITNMEKLSGSEFNKSYATSAVKDHEDAIALFTIASDKASDPDLKAFASKMLPTFKEHLKMAQDLETKVSAVTMNQ